VVNVPTGQPGDILVNRFPLSRRKFLTLSGAGALGALASGGFPSALGAADDPKNAQKEAASAVNTFAADLYLRLAGPKSQEKGALFLSPFSIETALAMTSAGARNKTLEEMEKVLHLPKEPHAAFGELVRRLNQPAADIKRSYQLSVANAIWAQKGYPWEKEFVELTKKHYGAGTVEVDFAESEAARKQINEWVEKETQQKIKELIAPGVITALTRMVLANAIYFKSNWLYQFDKKKTADAPFTRDDGTKADVPLMTLTGKLNCGEFNMFVLRAGEKVQVLELPYAGKELSMFVFLPPDHTGVHRLAQWLSAKVIDNLQVKETDVKVFLPRFKAESAFSLKSVLMDMGMKLAFTSADFTGMSPKGKELYITHVLHKAFVDVNEEGTEAAAATAVVIGKSAAPKVKEFRADRPFVFLIRDNETGATLFQGRYTGPKA
jgi:serpin B